MSTPSRSGFYAYDQLQGTLLAQIRRETYGEDLGQFSWITADELRTFVAHLRLAPDSHLLDVACGSGGPTLFIAETTGARVTGIDMNESGITTATNTAQARGLSERGHFAQIDAGKPLPFGDATFDAIISIDAMNHFADRAPLLLEWRRVLRPDGWFLFTDAVVVTGTLSREEILARSSSMGLFLFTPAGVHEQLIKNAGFTDLAVEDVTETIAAVTKRWHAAREKRQTQLLQFETPDQFEDLQKMLAAAHLLAKERRLSRFAYRARKPGSA